MVSLREILKNGESALKKAGIENFKFETRLLFEKAFGADIRSADLSALADENTVIAFEELIKRRLGGEPLQYILGEWEFYSIPIKVGPGVLIPRQDTETLVDAAVSLFRDKKNIKVLDLCSGSGCIALALEKNLSCSEVSAVEFSQNAFEYLKENIKINLSDIKPIAADLRDSGFIASLGQYDLITANPPYLDDSDMKSLQKEVGYEPPAALYGGEDGLDFYRFIIRNYKRKLSGGGVLAVETGIGQHDEVSDMFIANGYKNVRARKDLCGVFRVVTGENDG